MSIKVRRVGWNIGYEYPFIENDYQRWSQKIILKYWCGNDCCLWSLKIILDINVHLWKMIVEK